MMSREVAGIPLTDFTDPIRDALATYSRHTEGRYEFDLDEAAELKFVDGKLTARSQSAVTTSGEKVADLFVLAFAPNDGTGDDQTYKPSEVDLSSFSPDKKYIPRSKAAAHSEVHLTIASKIIDKSHDPSLFAGHLSVLGLVDGNRVAEIGYVGQESHSFANRLPSGILPGHASRPSATLTTGYQDRGVMVHSGGSGERFGDPHAIVNRVNYTVQVAGFIALTYDNPLRHLQLFHQLGAVPFPSEPI